MEFKDYSFEIDLESQELNVIETHPNKLLESISQAELDRLNWFIFDVLGDKDGSPEIGNIEISNFKINPDHFSGAFRLKFQIDRKFCCSDMESCSNDYIDFQFIMNGSKLFATGKYFDWTLNN
jgi:hypothetical protein